MRRTFSIFLFIFFCSIAHINAQVKFFHIFSNNGYDYGESVVELRDSSYFISGSSSSFSESNDVFLTRLSRTGDILWSRNYGGTESDLNRKMLNLNDSILFLIGYGNSSPSSDFDLSFRKLDTSGNILVENTLLQNGWQRPYNAIFSNDSLIYVVGETTETPDNLSNGWIVKLNRNGDTLWTQNLGADGNDLLRDIYQLNDTTFIAVGETWNADSTMTKGWLINVAPDGEIRWDKQFGTFGDGSLFDIYESSGKLYGSGYGKGGTENIYRLRLVVNSDGSLNAEEYDLNDGTYYITEVCFYGSVGKTYAINQFQNQYSAGGSMDVGITRYWPDLYWDQANLTVGTGGYEQNNDIKSTLDGGAIAIGFTQDVNTGGSGVYVVKIGPDDDFPTPNYTLHNSLLSLHENKAVSIRIHPNPASDYFVISPDISYELVDLAGKIVLKGKADSNGKIESGSVQPGTYLVHTIDSSGRIECQKLVLYAN